jgi:hypothetical protein
MNPEFRRIVQAQGPAACLAVVGRTVRAHLPDRVAGDWDLATAPLPEVVLARAAGVEAIPTGLQHGTVTLVEGGRTFEVTTFQGDGAYLDGRHPETVTRCFSDEPMICVPGEFGARLEAHIYRSEQGPNGFTRPSPSYDDPFGLSLID